MKRVTCFYLWIVAVVALGGCKSSATDSADSASTDPVHLSLNGTLFKGLFTEYSVVDTVTISFLQLDTVLYGTLHRFPHNEDGGGLTGTVSGNRATFIVPLSNGSPGGQYEISLTGDSNRLSGPWVQTFPGPSGVRTAQYHGTLDVVRK